MIRIVRGEPTGDELAALITVLLSRQPAPPARAPGPSPWTRSGRPTGTGFDRGARGWRAPAAPR